MKYVPILFSTPMVKSILDGKKWQTRRIIKPQPTDLWMEACRKESPTLVMFEKYGKQIFWIEGPLKKKKGWWQPTEIKPKAKPGDCFWTRETWGIGTRPHPIFGWMDGFEFKADELFLQDDIEDLPIYPNEDIDFSQYENGKEGWRPSIFMPKEACRIFLKVTNVRIERLHDISEEDAMAEGILYYDCEITQSREFKDYVTKVEGYGHPDYDYPSVKTARESFFTLWESINGKESLDANPWLFVYDYERIEKPQGWPTI